MGYWDNFYIDEMLKYAKSSLRVDTSKIFLTGLSLGGGGAWAYPNTSVAHAKQFAAIAPVCGVCYYTYSTLCSTIGAAGLPVWGFTNADDNVVSPTCTVQACDALTKCNPGKIKKTVYPSGGHDAWTKAYDTGHSIQTGMNMYEWFLSNTATPAPAPPNQAPVANPGTAQTVTLPVNSVTLTGSASFDPDGDAITYRWSKLSGPSEVSFVNNASAITLVNNLVEGVYSFSLVVTDNNGASSTAAIQVTVKPVLLPVNVAPVVNAGSAVTISLPLNIVTLNGSATDADGTITSYRWTLVSGPSQPLFSRTDSSSTQVSSLVAGIYVFRLTVTDNAGATAYHDIQTTVNPPLTATPPVADAGKDERIPVGQATVIRGEKSYAVNGTIQSYSWTKFSGPDKYEILSPASSASWIRNMAAGTYVYRLRVTDSNGQSSYDDVTITVYDNTQPLTNAAPVAKAGNDTTITLPVDGLTLNGNGSSDTDGTIAGFNWTLVSGPSQPVLTASGSAMNISNLITGTYMFRLAVTDDSGASSSDTVAVTVQSAITTTLPPVADAGKDETIPVGQATVLRGEKSTAPGGTIKTYYWTVVSGPGTYEILSPSASATWIRRMVAGKYTYRLTIVDNNGATSYDDVIINVYQYTSNTASNTLALREQPTTEMSTVKISVFPNPVINTLKLHFASSYSGKVNARVFDMQGKLVKSSEVNKAQLLLQTDVDVSSLKPGSYILQLALETGEKLTSKFIRK
jgi:hypothetical protein